MNEKTRRKKKKRGAQSKTAASKSLPLFATLLVVLFTCVGQRPLQHKEGAAIH
jgi:hypothetical protein